MLWFSNYRHNITGGIEMNKLGGLLIFMIGAGTGASIAYYVIDKRYKEEIEDLERQIKESYDALEDTESEEVEENTEPEKSSAKDISTLKTQMLANKREIIDYANIVKEEKYTEEVKEDTSVIDGEIILSEDIEDFGEEPYDVVFATIYADGYLVDSNDHIISLDMIGGEEALEHFGMDEDNPNLLRVRNTLYEIDYEIDKDDRTYAEVSGKDPADLPDMD